MQPPTARNIVLAHGSMAKFFKQELEADIVCLQEVGRSAHVGGGGPQDHLAGDTDLAPLV